MKIKYALVYWMFIASGVMHSSSKNSKAIKEIIEQTRKNSILNCRVKKYHDFLRAIGKKADKLWLDGAIAITQLQNKHKLAHSLKEHRFFLKQEENLLLAIDSSRSKISKELAQACNQLGKTRANKLRSKL